MHICVLIEGTALVGAILRLHWALRAKDLTVKLLWVLLWLLLSCCGLRLDRLIASIRQQLLA